MNISSWKLQNSHKNFTSMGHNLKCYLIWIIWCSNFLQLFLWRCGYFIISIWEQCARCQIMHKIHECGTQNIWLSPGVGSIRGHFQSREHFFQVVWKSSHSDAYSTSKLRPLFMGLSWFKSISYCTQCYIGGEGEVHNCCVDWASRIVK